MCFDAKLYLEKDKRNAWVINLFLDSKIAKNVPTSHVLTSKQPLPYSIVHTCFVNAQIFVCNGLVMQKCTVWYV
jgi:hypothetical protein